ncbi:glycine receptor subunit alpha-2-like isoform X2 [Mya arenaria]|uniref:glycine receptor subunit alpha-2-like isoform X2 n=1 Tax=Mya arenaria TaxID=6604 RepID=UPI0022E7DD57|nr:glycine receptor subunit alpha-2-like isoform X2 [Mya arenaria]XP_052794137.1 glycine receptor subunit alpha-2-like isoform X2 [Mya arenaria]
MMRHGTAFQLLISSIVLVSVSLADASSNYTLSAILDKLFDKANYDKKLPPRYDKPSWERQVEVTVNMFIVNMFAVSEIDMEYSMSLFLRERWKDSRLVYNDTLNLTRIELDPSMFGAIWQPDMFIATEKYSDFHEVTVRNQMVHIYPNGIIQYSARVTGAFFCAMDLRKYPFDTQECEFELESYGFDTTKLKFIWDDPPMTMSKNIKLPQFNLTSISTYNCDREYFGIKYPCIGVKFILERDYSFYLIQIFVPSILIVILSWVNFWLDCTSVPGRVSLALLTVLTMTTQSSGARENLPAVSYVKAIDVWMAACLAFVFLGLVEFAYVNVQSRVSTRRQMSYSKPVHELVQAVHNNMNGDINENEKENESQTSSESTCDTKEHLSNKGSECTKSYLICLKSLAGIERARAVDKISRVLFPLLFIIFNICYWTYVFLWSPAFMEGL